MALATESPPRKDEKGLVAQPQQESYCLLDRMRETLIPDPEPPLKITPSFLNQSRIECMSSPTERMKQADACCGTPSTPMLNHTGELKDACWWTMRYFSSTLRIWASLSVAKYPPSIPPFVIRST